MGDTSKYKDNAKNAAKNGSDDTHDKLVKTYLEYFKTYDHYMERGTVRGYYAHQKNVRELYRLAKLLNKELQEEFYNCRPRPRERWYYKKTGYKQRKNAKQEQDKGKDV